MFLEAKQMLYGKIDHYIRDNITIAGKVIQDVAADKIRDGDVVLTFARCVCFQGAFVVNLIIVADLQSLKRSFFKLTPRGSNFQLLLLTQDPY